MWQEGHYWVSKVPIVTQSPLFRYSYIIIDHESGKKIDGEESGIRRIADLASCDSLNEDVHGNEEIESCGYNVNTRGYSKHIDINDIWDTIKVKFSVLHSKIQNH